MGNSRQERIAKMKAQSEAVSQQLMDVKGAKEDLPEPVEGVGIKLPLKDIIKGRNIRFGDSGEHINLIKESIEDIGLLQPVGVLRHKQKEGKYILACGYTRVAAVELIDGMDEIDAVILPDDVNVAKIQVEENKKRKDNSIWEEYYGRYKAIEFEELRYEGIKTNQLENLLGYPAAMQSKCRKIGRAVDSEKLKAFYGYQLNLNRVLVICGIVEDLARCDEIVELEEIVANDASIEEVNRWIDAKHSERISEKKKKKSKGKEKNPDSNTDAKLKTPLLKECNLELMQVGKERFLSVGSKKSGFSLAVSKESLVLLDEIKNMIEEGLKE